MATRVTLQRLVRQRLDQFRGRYFCQLIEDAGKRRSFHTNRHTLLAEPSLGNYTLFDYQKLTAVVSDWSIVRGQLSVVRGQLSVVRGQLSVGDLCVWCIFVDRL